jgi:hypothetical protein
MECDYTHLNHNSLVSKKNGHQGHDYKGVYCIKIGQIKIVFPWKSGKYVGLKASNCP